MGCHYRLTIAHLELNVAGVLHVALQVHVAVAKSSLRLLLRLLQQRQELALILQTGTSTSTRAWFNECLIRLL